MVDGEASARWQLEVCEAWPVGAAVPLTVRSCPLRVGCRRSMAWARLWRRGRVVSRRAGPLILTRWHCCCSLLVLSYSFLRADAGFDPLYLSNYLDQDYAAQGELKSTLLSGPPLSRFC